MTTTQILPTRFREAEARGARMGALLRRIAQVEQVDDELMDRIGRAHLSCDRLGATLADAIRTRAVSMKQVRAVLAGESVEDAPAPLRDLVATLSVDPPWLDRELMARGARIYRRWGRNVGDVALQLSLIGGYRFGGPTDLLVATGALTGDASRRRLAETQKWAITLSDPGSLEVGGEAWRLTLHVRIMHAMVNAGFTDQWDVERWGLPINDADQAATLGLFDAVILLGVRALGVPVSASDSRAVMHLWKYVGWLMGVDEQFLVDTERERHRINYHILLAQADITEAGPLLAQSIVEAQRDLDFAGPSALRPLQALYTRERLLSMLTVFLGRSSMRELGLPLRPPWAHAAVIARNTLDHRILGRTPWGRRRLDRLAVRATDELMRRYYGRDVAQELGAIRGA